MWKLVLAFAVFAALTIFILDKGGDIDMGGEKHGAEAAQTVETTRSTAVPAASEPTAPASMAK
jgi:hypothetical protein